MSHGLKLLLLAASTIITMMIVTVSVNLARKAGKMDDQYAERLDVYYHDLDCGEITSYDGECIYGADVVNFMKRMLSGYHNGESAPVQVTVITSQSPLISYTYSNQTYLKEAQNFTDTRYIRPLSRFVGSVVYNANDVITEVIFTVQ